MARVLIVSSAVPRDLADGWHMRIFNFCRTAAARHSVSLFVAPVGDADARPPEGDLFDRVAFLPGDLVMEKTGGRIWRTTDADFLRRWSPRYFDALREQLAGVCADWDIDVIVNCSGIIAEVAPTLDIPCITDITDCRTLTLERRLANRTTSPPLRQRMELALKRMRVSKRERALVRAYDAVTTIAEPDRQHLLRISGQDPSRVLVVPNGVADQALAARDPDGTATRSVVFWGNLDFPPNRTAVDWFHEKIYAPLLAGRGIDWHIVGAGAAPAIQQLAAEDGIHVHGYVDDLYSFIADKGVMVNPMVEGSGLKNKVLEAFAVGLPVVSTTMGIEAIDATKDEHYLRADSPGRFADCVTRLLDDRALARRLSGSARHLVETGYTWQAVGAKFEQALRRVLPEPGEHAAQSAIQYGPQTETT